MRIGIECELHSSRNDILSVVAVKEKLDTCNFSKVKWYSFDVMLSKEYYPTTIEYNFSILENNKSNIDEVGKYLNEQISKYSLELYSSAPSYVWTHVHIFDEDRLNSRISNLLFWICEYYISIIDEFKKLDVKSLERLILGHQLWWNFSRKHNHIWRDLLSDKWFSPCIYWDTKSKPKYNPIIFSPASERWKPTSLEIRIIPNEFIFDGNLTKLLSLVEKRKLPKWDLNSFTKFTALILDEIRSRRPTQTRRTTESVYGVGTFVKGMQVLSGDFTSTRLYKPSNLNHALLVIYRDYRTTNDTNYQSIINWLVFNREVKIVSITNRVEDFARQFTQISNAIYWADWNLVWLYNLRDASSFTFPDWDLFYYFSWSWNLHLLCPYLELKPV